MLWEWAEDAELSEGAVTAEPSTAGRSPVPLLDQALSHPIPSLVTSQGLHW